jgi:hypothetical protein
MLASVINQGTTNLLSSHASGLPFREVQTMNERKDSTIEKNEDEPSTTKRDQEQHGYYYDDETGYELYDPSKDEEEDDNMNDQNNGSIAS